MTATRVRRDKAALSSGCKAHPAIIWSNILGVVGMVAFSGFRSIAMINLAGV